MKRFNKAKLYLTVLSFIVGLCVSPGGIAADESQDITGTSKSMHLRVSYKSKVEPLPLNRIHSWVLHVATLDGEPVEKAKITVYGGMPAHNHGLPTEPLVTEIGDGDYLVEGLKFSMTGVWEIRFEIHTDNVIDKTKFKIRF